MDVFPEDYYFWLLLRKNNCQFLNIPDVLVNMRTTENYLERRIGMTYLRKEMKMLTVAWNRGLIDSLDLFYHILFKPIVRLQPARIFLVSLKLNRYLFK